MSRSSSIQPAKKHIESLELQDKVLGIIVVSFWAFLLVFGLLTLVLGDYWLGKAEKTGRYTEAKSFKNQADLLMQEQKYQQAIHIYNDVLKLSPDYLDALGNSAIAHMNLKQYDKAIQQYKTLLKKGYKEPEKCYAGIATCYQHKNDISKAIEYYTKAEEASPIEGKNSLSLAHLLAGQSNFPEAIKHYEAGIRSISSFKDEYLRMLAKLRNINIVENTFSDKSSEDISKLYHELMNSAPSDEELSARYSKGHFNSTLYYNRELADAYNNLGLCYAQIGRLQEAKSNFEYALKILPGYKGAERNLSLVKKDLNK